MIKRIFLILTILSFCEIQAQTKLPGQKPKLVIGIVVDQMRYDFISKYWGKFGKDGFQKLVGEGFFCKNTNYNYVPTYTAPGHASIYTGTTPSGHGIVGNNWFDRKENKNIYCTNDKDVTSIGCSSNAGLMSPENMLSTTVTDELRIFSNKRSKVIGIALKDRGAILPAGHAANAAYWFDNGTGQWISSSYYMNELPGWIKAFNEKGLAGAYLSKPWTTLIPLDQYTESIADNNKYEGLLPGETNSTFPHDLPEIYKRTNNYDILRYTPFGNSLTKDLAIEAIKNENLGKSADPDFLTVSFSSTDYIGHKYGPASIEVEDTYLRMDKDIAELLKFVDAWVGKNNTLVFLTADHGVSDVPAYLKEMKIPAGTFDQWDAIGQLKQNLFHVYGDSLVESYYNSQIYLNDKVIEEKKLSKEEIENRASKFLMKMPGIHSAVPVSLFQASEFTVGQNMLIKNGLYYKRSGDIIIVLEPGWMENEITGTTHGSGYSYDTRVPLIWYGWKIKPGASFEAVNITDIAPTVSMFLDIPFPNGCSGKPILFLNE